MRLISFRYLRAFAGIATLVGLSRARAGEFSYELPNSATTSAGVYDEHGRLVQVLWTREPKPAGKATAQWDGKDQFGKSVEGGTYEFRIVANRATYTNVGAIGNSARSPTPLAHTPANINSVAVDPTGGICTSNGWDEAAQDFTHWDAAGNVICDAGFQIRNGQPNGEPYAIAADDSTIFCAVEGWPREPWNHKQQVQRFALSDGKPEKFTEVPDKFGHIELYEWPEHQIPKGTSAADAELMRLPLRALAVSGKTLLVADALVGKIRRFNKVSGRPDGGFDVKLPSALAVDRDGRIWVGHEHGRVGIFSPDGKPIAEPLERLGEIVAIAFGPDRRLYVADRAAGRVLIYDIVGEKAILARTFGQPAKAGDRAADHFFQLRGVAVDSHGFMVTIQTDPAETDPAETDQNGGARIARWTPDGKLDWEHFGCEFVSLGDYGADDPDTFYSMSFHRYHLLDHAAGRWEFTGTMVGEKLVYQSDVRGVPRLLKLGGRKFWFMPTGDGLQVYRIGEHEMRLAAILGASSPDVQGNPRGSGRGQWSWSDPTTDGKLLPADVQWFKKPGQGRYDVFGVDVDSHGDVWFGELNTHSIWTVPLAGLNSAGNPIYAWAQAREVVAKDTSPLEFEPNMAQRADDGSIYALGWSKRWPPPKGNPFWMGGTTLVRFDARGQRLWAVPLPDVAPGMDTIPGGSDSGHSGGCVVGLGKKATLLHYTADGLLIGSVSPGAAMAKESGWFDEHACVAVNRDRRDGILDVFAEDDFTIRIGWYRIDDRKIDVVRGKIVVK